MKKMILAILLAVVIFVVHVQCKQTCVLYLADLLFGIVYLNFFYRLADSEFVNRRKRIDLGDLLLALMSRLFPLTFWGGAVSITLYCYGFLWFELFCLLSAIGLALSVIIKVCKMIGQSL